MKPFTIILYKSNCLTEKKDAEIGRKKSEGQIESEREKKRSERKGDKERKKKTATSFQKIKIDRKKISKLSNVNFKV